MPSTLDKKRSYGVVYGDGACRFTQDNKEFDGLGNEIVKPGTKVEPPKKEWKIALEEAVVAVGNHKPLEDKPMAELHRELKAATGKGAKFGSTREQIIEKIQAAQ